MPNSLIFCIPVKNCIINSTATLDRPQGLEIISTLPSLLPCLPPKGRNPYCFACFFLICSPQITKLPCLHQWHSPSFKIHITPGPWLPRDKQWHLLPISTGWPELESPCSQMHLWMKLKHCGLLLPFPSCASGGTATTDTVDVFSHPRGMATWLLSGAQLEPWLSLDIAFSGHSWWSGHYQESNYNLCSHGYYINFRNTELQNHES